MIRQWFRPLAHAEALLVHAIARLRPPHETVWTRCCMDCGETYGFEQRLPYEEQHGPRAVSHGICQSCAVVRGLDEGNPVIDISTDAFGSE